MLTPMKAIRAKCLDCPLWPYRKGHRPAKAPTDAHSQNENPAEQEPERRRVEE